jgi:nicotinate-nucleotide--dimethylbenzimidazole phosphoribosyltransferase
VNELLARIRPADEQARAAAQAAFDAKTKPRASLGRLEELATRLAAIRGEVPARLEPAIVVAAADHGVAAEGVSAYPQEVTAQMVANFAGGGAAICVLAREAGAELVLVDAGTAAPVEHACVRPLRIAAGTANLAHGAAMESEQALRALLAGAELAAELAAAGHDLVALGEMGIGNTTSAAALVAALLAVDPVSVCGRGCGLDDAGVARKVDVVRRALALHGRERDPLGVLAAVGGFEIAFLTGLALGCAAERVAVLLDGFITGAAALVAARLAPACVEVMLAAHRSPEPGHALVLDALRLEPLLDLGLRLGEGSGAALAIPLLRSSIALLNEMASFDSAGVTDAGR